MKHKYQFEPSEQFLDLAPLRERLARPRSESRLQAVPALVFLTDLAACALIIILLILALFL